MEIETSPGEFFTATNSAVSAAGGTNHAANAAAANAGDTNHADQDYADASDGILPGGDVQGLQVLSDIPADPISDMELRMPSMMRQESQYQRARRGVPPMCVPLSVFLWGEYDAMIEHMTFWPREYSGRRLGLVKAKQLLVLRVVLLLLSLGLLGWDLWIEFDVGLEAWFMVHVCYWAILVQVLYAATAIFVTHKACRVHYVQLSMPCVVKWPAKLAFGLYHLAFPLSLLVLLLYWIIPGRELADSLDESAALQRGISLLLAFLLLLADALITAQPLFMPLLPFLPLFATVYVVFSVIYWKAKGLSGGIWQPTSSPGGGYIAGALEWEEHNGLTAGWAVAVILGFCPLAFLFSWTLLGAWWRLRGGKARPGKDTGDGGGEDHAMSDYSEHGLYATPGQERSNDLRDPSGHSQNLSAFDLPDGGTSPAPAARPTKPELTSTEEEGPQPVDV